MPMRCNGETLCVFLVPRHSCNTVTTAGFVEPTICMSAAIRRERSRTPCGYSLCYQRAPPSPTCHRSRHRPCRVLAEHGVLSGCADQDPDCDILRVAVVGWPVDGDIKKFYWLHVKAGRIHLKSGSPRSQGEVSYWVTLKSRAWDLISTTWRRRGHWRLVASIDSSRPAYQIDWATVEFYQPLLWFCDTS
jgi:hypothetical protein